MPSIIWIVLFLLVWTFASIAWFFNRLGDTRRNNSVLDYILFPPVMAIAWTIGLFQ